MFKIAEKPYVPLNFNQMLTYLTIKNEHRQTMKYLLNDVIYLFLIYMQKDKKLNATNDMQTFIQIFNGKCGLLDESRKDVNPFFKN